MRTSTVIDKEKYIQEIRSKVLEISGPDTGNPVNMENVVFYESGKPNYGNKINVTCLFINEDGNVCADMYRSGSAGCVDFICGLDLNSVNEKILIEIKSALVSNRWSVPEFNTAEKQKKKNTSSSFKIPFLPRGA